MYLFYQFAGTFGLMSSILFTIESVKAGEKLNRVFYAFMAGNFMFLSIIMIANLIMLIMSYS